jgi:exodeoxyribonuclease-1
MYPAEQGCIALVVPLAMHPVNKNEVIVYDLRVDPQPFLSLGSKEMGERLFVRQDELPVGSSRLPIKTIHINKSPVVVPANTMSPESAERWKINTEEAQKHLEALNASPQFANNCQAIFKDRDFEPVTDPDFMLYSGGFFSNNDRARMEVVHETEPSLLKMLDLPFDDKRLPEMLFRYRARNYPETLDQDEMKRWNEFRQQRLLASNGESGTSLENFQQTIVDLRNKDGLDEKGKKLLEELEQYAQDIVSPLSN